MELYNHGEDEAQKTDFIRVRVNPNVKHDAEEILHHLGITPSEALRMFYAQIIMHEGMPFDVKIPNAETKKAIAQVKSRKGLKKHKDFKAFKKSLGE